MPLVVGNEAECARLAAGLRAEGIHVDAIMFPAVARGQSRLRFIMIAHHTSAHIEHVVQTLQRLVRRSVP